MSLFNNTSNLFINGNSVSLAYLNGNQIFSASISENGGGDTPIITSGLVLNLDAADYGGSGDWMDTSGNSNDGALIQSPTYSSNDSGYFDFTGGFYASSGTGLYDHIRVLDDDTLDVLSSISIEMWINIDTFNASSAVNMLFSKRGSTSNGYVGFFTNTGFIFRIGTASPSQLSWSTTSDLSTWQQIVITVGSGGSKIYHNGIEVVDNPSYVGNFAAVNTPANLLIGDINPISSGVYAFNGKMSVFRIYNDILSPTDVLNNFNSIKDRYGL
jgi:hypothetical protein